MNTKSKLVYILIGIVISVITVFIAMFLMSENGNKCMDEVEVKSSRPLHAELQIKSDGATINVPATLYVGKGYSVYIPDDNWIIKESRATGSAIDIWESDTGTGGYFQIVSFENTMDTELAREQLLQNHGNPYSLEHIGDEVYKGENDGTMIEFRLVGESDNQYFYTVQSYSAQEAGDVATALNAIANSFKIESKD